MLERVIREQAGGHAELAFREGNCDGPGLTCPLSSIFSCSHSSSPTSDTAAAAGMATSRGTYVGWQKRRVVCPRREQPRMAAPPIEGGGEMVLTGRRPGAHWLAGGRLVLHLLVLKARCGRRARVPSDGGVFADEPLDPDSRGKADSREEREAPRGPKAGRPVLHSVAEASIQAWVRDPGASLEWKPGSSLPPHPFSRALSSTPGPPVLRAGLPGLDRLTYLPLPSLFTSKSERSGGARPRSTATQNRLGGWS